MGESIRIKTQLGINQNINVELQQEFDYLEILSFRIRQEDVYTRSCANYGVIVGRVTANNGFGIPNAKVSIFIPIDSIDESNPIVQSIYPYKSPTDKNEDGYRYNLLPYEKSYSKHAATGTFPSRLDVLTGDTTVVEIFEKYYRFTVKTNESGDYMIMGAPIGLQTIVMDVDLSDIGEFSLTPQDLIRMGLATESQVAGNKFKTSTDLGSLPQIVNLTKTIEVLPLWGDPEVCQIDISRVDFDLRSEASIDIEPTAIFMGSMFSSSDKVRVRYQRNKCKIKPDLGSLCQLTTGPGQILALRQTISQGSDGLPILEQYQIEQSGNVIDEDGVWLIELPMNLEYVVTNEFGERIISNDPAIGIPTKAKYRFKIKWQQSPALTQQNRRAYYLVPNVREYGWGINGGSDPYNSNSEITKEKLRGSYYFGLDWSGYTNPQAAVNCEDTFYEFKFNKVYTVSSLIDQYKSDEVNIRKFVGVKDINNDDCLGRINKFPTNDGVMHTNARILFFAFVFSYIQRLLTFFLVIAHIAFFVKNIFTRFACLICKIRIFGIRPFAGLCRNAGINCEETQFNVFLPMLTYPECSSCDCKDSQVDFNSIGGGNDGSLTYLSLPEMYTNNLQTNFALALTPRGSTTPSDSEDIPDMAFIYAQALAGNGDDAGNVGLFKMPKSSVVRYPSDDKRRFTYSTTLPLGERVNIFNLRDAYFDELNKIKVSFANDVNIGTYHYDNTITVLSTVSYSAGQLLTTVDPTTTKDKNFLFTASTNTGVVNGITGTTNSGPFTLNVTYAKTELSDNTVTYSIPTGSTIERQIYPSDIEYFQVVTAITVSDAIKIWSTSQNFTGQTFPDLLMADSEVYLLKHAFINYTRDDGTVFNNPLKLYENYGSQYIVILQRGVDPYSPLYNNKYSLGRIFGKSIDDNGFVVTAQTRLNIPIQKLPSPNISVQPLNQFGFFQKSYFFTPGNEFSSFTTSIVGYYGALDSTLEDGDILIKDTINNVSGVRSARSNNFYSIYPNTAQYDKSEDLSGGALMYVNISPDLLYKYNDFDYVYKTPSLVPYFTGSPMNITSGVRNVMRLDRLPSSDQLNGRSWYDNPALLQQNNNFTFYAISNVTPSQIVPFYPVGAQMESQDIEGLPLEQQVLDSFDCPGMVALSCYSGNGQNFGIKKDCAESDYVVNGCYGFVKNPIVDLGIDQIKLREWGLRYRFFYAICNDIISETFVNNWVNGTLFAFPFQALTFFDKKNKPKPPKFCKDVIYFDDKTNNFYYRSSPYYSASTVSSSKFVGNFNEHFDTRGINKNNLQFPTTLVDLGYKDNFYSEIVYDPSNQAYIMNQLESTSYGDTTDLTNLFAISRITNQSFLSLILKSLNNAPWDILFSRPSRRVDGDFAQAISINSEEGVIKFSSQFYESTVDPNIDPVRVIGNGNNPTMGIFFSSTTDNLQLKDFITPGTINIYNDEGTKVVRCYFGIDSQEVPYYQWQLGNSNNIFGNQYNNWATNESDIFSKKYQVLDRSSIQNPTYFINSEMTSNPNQGITTNFARGYIFNVSANTEGDFIYSINRKNYSTKFLVGAPFQFYFGINAGKSAIDKFKIKYSVSE